MRYNIPQSNSSLLHDFALRNELTRLTKGQTAFCHPSSVAAYRAWASIPKRNTTLWQNMHQVLLYSAPPCVVYGKAHKNIFFINGFQWLDRPINELPVRAIKKTSITGYTHSGEPILDPETEWLISLISWVEVISLIDGKIPMEGILCWQRVVNDRCPPEILKAITKKDRITNKHLCEVLDIKMSKLTHLKSKKPKQSTKNLTLEEIIRDANED